MKPLLLDRAEQVRDIASRGLEVAGVLGGQGHAADALAPELVAETILPFLQRPRRVASTSDTTDL